MFNVGNREHFKYYAEKAPWYMDKYLFRRDVAPMEPLCQIYDESGSGPGSGNEKGRDQIA